MTEVINIQNSLAAGELSPALFGRIDLEKWQSGTSTCRNFFVNYRGGVSSRAGLAYVGTCKQPGTSAPPRDISFQFSVSQGYTLEFGDQYMRIKVNGGYVTEAVKVVTSVSVLGLFTTSAVHGYSVGDWVYDTGNTGFSGLTWIITSVPTTSTFTVTDLFGNAIGLVTASGAGTVARIYTVTSPYAAVDLPYLKYTQSADTMTLCCVNQETGTEYVSYELTRHALTNWTFTADTFTTGISAPTGLSGTAVSSTIPSTYYTYVVTAVSSTTGEESVASTPAYVFNNDIAINAGSNILKWTAVAGALQYNIYAAVPCYGTVPPVSGIYGYIGTSIGLGFVDTNIIPDFSTPPPTENNPFAQGPIIDILPATAGSSYSQTTIGYSITTGTGSGFSGTPVVVNGQFVGFAIKNRGKNYRNTDTITITDSGGQTAQGYFAFSGQPAAAETIIVNGSALRFKSELVGIASTETSIFGTLALTLQAACTVLNNSLLLPWTLAKYEFYDNNKILVTYKTAGAAGNAFTLGAGTCVNCTVSAATLTGGGIAGSGATATLTVGALTGTYPSVPSYFQQRRVYANSLNFPDTYWMSKPGLYSNMDYSIPSVANDYITGNPWAQQVNGIQWLVPMPGGLVILTGKGAWQLNGGGQYVPVTPSNQIATPQAYNGCHFGVPPLVINYDILYLQAKGNIVRDLSYSFYLNIYTGTDLTALSNHLFVNSQIEQWCWAEEPFKLVWAIKADGGLLSLTYLKEQEIYAWTRHDTNGSFVSVCSITEASNGDPNNTLLPLVDAVYFIVKRYVQGAWRYYSERMDNRIWVNVEEAFCVDSGLSSPISYPDVTLTPGSISGSNIPFTASSSVFTAGSVGDVIRVSGGKATVVTYNSPVQVHCDITEDLTVYTPDDPNDTPAPSTSGTWSISTPVTVISGLNHLEGLSVAILADGSVVEDQIVTNGSVTLNNAASKICIGLPYTCQVQTLYIDHPDNSGTSQNRRKVINSVGLRVEASRGLQLGTDQLDQSTLSNTPTDPPWTDMNEIKERTMNVFAGTAVPLYTGDYFKNVSSAWGIKGQVAVQQVYPLPANILSCVTYWNIGDDH